MHAGRGSAYRVIDRLPGPHMHVCNMHMVPAASVPRLAGLCRHKSGPVRKFKVGPTRQAKYYYQVQGSDQVSDY